MLTRYRRALLFLALASVIVLAIYAPEPEQPSRRVRESPSAAIDSTVSARAGEVNSGRPMLGDVPERNILGSSNADLFGTRSWQPPPPKVVAPPPGSLAPPPPPAQSYRFAGRLIQDGNVQLFVSKGDTPVAVKPGANLDGYVIESVSFNAIELVYPPSGHKERIFVPPTIPGDAPAVPAAMRAAPVASPVPMIPPTPTIPPKPFKPMIPPKPTIGVPLPR